MQIMSYVGRREGSKIRRSEKERVEGRDGAGRMEKGRREGLTKVLSQ